MADIFGRTCSAGRALEARGNAIAKEAKTYLREKRRAHSRSEIGQSVKEMASYFRKKAVGVDGSTQYFEGACLKACANDGIKCKECRHFSHLKAITKRPSRKAAVTKGRK